MSTKVGSATGSVLLICDDSSLEAEARVKLAEEGFFVSAAENSEDVWGKVDEYQYDIIIYQCEPDALGIVSELHEQTAATIIVVTAISSFETIKEALSFGAYDALSAPITADDLVLAVNKASEREKLRHENKLLRDQVSKRYSFQNIIAQSASMQEIFETVKKISDYKTTALICGESGTGKELIARALHYNSTRRAKRFVAINCGAIPENLLESELFGHRKGAFTDATRDKKGLFEVAEGGTIFLDEIGELPLHLQVKILRVLQEQEIRPVGDERLVKIDVRVIAATLRDLEQDVLAGRFRDDLYYRLNVITLRIPPLRERREDIPLLVNFFVKKHREKLGLPVYGISPEALQALSEYSWPGNIRELENCIERAMILTEGELISLESLPKAVHADTGPANNIQFSDDDLSIKNHTRSLEENLIRRALEITNGNRTHAAKLLEISHRTLLYKLKEYSIS